MHLRPKLILEISILNPRNLRNPKINPKTHRPQHGWTTTAEIQKSIPEISILIDERGRPRIEWRANSIKPKTHGNHGKQNPSHPQAHYPMATENSQPNTRSETHSHIDFKSWPRFRPPKANLKPWPPKVDLERERSLTV